MYDDFLLNDKYDKDIQNTTNDLDNLFDSLTNDINSFNKYVDDINKQRKENSIEVKELLEEKQRIDKAKLEFENYVRVKNEEYDKKMRGIDDYLNIQKQNLLKSESDFKTSMDNSLNELEIEKKELQIQREQFKEEKEQFENYKNIELNRIRHAEEILESEKNQFERYKEVTNKKIELENKNLQQKCDKFKDLISQFNSSFKPTIKEEEEV